MEYEMTYVMLKIQNASNPKK
jgi:hypothetical protein